MLIYKIFRTEEWVELEATGETAGAPIDIADGFIHFSTAGQVAETAAKHFRGEDGLFLATLDADGLGETLKWDVSRGGALFPHLYRHLRREDVLRIEPLLLGPHGHDFPDLA
jgi:uncharacterized protein (DUF952 family)